MLKIELLDLYCGGGGCSVGYKQAADQLGIKINITGIDNKPQKNYPFNFIQADAITYLKENYKRFSHFHASPPCQKYSISTSIFQLQGKTYSNDLEIIKPLFYELELIGVIENVPQAPIRPDVVLTGDMFGLKVLRKRHFELVNWLMLYNTKLPKQGSVKDGDFVTVYGKASYGNIKRGEKLPKFKKETIKETWGFAMEIDWMTKDTELSQAIPPAYTKYIGLEFFKHSKS